MQGIKQSCATTDLAAYTRFLFSPFSSSICVDKIGEPAAGTDVDFQPGFAFVFLLTPVLLVQCCVALAA